MMLKLSEVTTCLHLLVQGKKGLRTTLWLTYGAVGVALGDLGT